jgi:hypothetical protein
MIEINRSCSPQQARDLRRTFREQGAVEAKSMDEARKIEATGKLAFVDHTNGGQDSFSAAEMADFRATDCSVPGAFAAHLRRFGRL